MGAITDFANPKNAKPVEFIADSKSRQYTIDFPVEGHLAKLTFDFGEANGEVDFDWISLHRQNEKGPELITEWKFNG